MESGDEGEWEQSDTVKGSKMAGHGTKGQGDESEGDWIT